MSIIKNPLLLYFLLFASFAFSQGRVSPQLADQAFQFDAGKTLFSISVKDTSVFQKKYADKISLAGNQRGNNYFQIRLQKHSALDDLKNDPNVIFIDHHRKPEEEGFLEFVNWGFNRITRAHNLFPDLKGASQNVSVKEQGFDPLDINLANRSFTTPVTPPSTSQHATNMTTLIAGGGNSSSQALGVAPQAHFTSSDFNNLLPDPISIFNSSVIRIQNHSYGVDIENYYGNEAFAYDDQVYNNPTLLHVFSVGNKGKSKPSSGTYLNLTFANLTGNFKQSKNVLVVNAVDTTLYVNAFNSRGPAFDGRLKPELTAFGQGGTSEAAALVSGISALLQEKHMTLHQKPSNVSMIKAILIATADDLGPAGIDYIYGYGSVNAFKAISQLDLNQTTTLTLSENELISFPITVPALVSEIKIAVSWTDPPAAINASTTLINDIDCWLEDGTSIIQPWVLNPYPHVDSIEALPKRKPDHLNNTEYITLDNPAPGTYQLHLKSGDLLGVSQNVSVAWWMNSEIPFSWDFPIGNDIVEGGEKNLLVWEAMPGKTGDLYQQLNNGNWELIESGLNLSHYVYWHCPDVLAKAKLKMNIEGQDFITDEFIISPSLEMNAAFICADTIGLTWNSIANATGYEVYTMGEQYLKKVASVNDTLIVLRKTSDQFFSVAPVFTAASGKKSETINYTQQGTFCYINLFTAERNGTSQIKVQLHLSSWYLVKQISIYKTTHEGSGIFKIISPGKSLQLEFNDPDLKAGLMSYQAEIVLQNGIKIVSDIIGIPIEEKGKVILYPNPISSSHDLTIVSEGGGVKFRILDLYGRVLMEKELNLVLDAIDVIQLPAGMYVYHLLSNESITDTGRFIKY